MERVKCLFVKESKETETGRNQAVILYMRRNDEAAQIQDRRDDTVKSAEQGVDRRPVSADID